MFDYKLGEDVPETGSLESFIFDPVDRVSAYMARFDAGLTKTGTMFDRLCRHQRRCEQGVWQIVDVHKHQIPLIPRLAQAMYDATCFDQAADGKPVRIRILKSRKTGISSKVQTKNVDFCTYYDNQTAVTIAHEKKATRDIFKIGQFAAKTHDGPVAKVLRHEITWSDTGSDYSCTTAGGLAVGAGSTPNLAHNSEGPKHPVNSKRETRYNLCNAVPDVPESEIVEEFTAKGRDEYFTSWMEAFHDPQHPYKAIFIPWFADATCRAEFAYQEGPFCRTDEENKLTARARKMGYELSEEQLEWRRRKIKGMPGGEVIFRQEYPSSPEEAVMGADGLVVRGLRDCIITELPFNLDYVTSDDLVGGIDPGYQDPCVIWSGVFRDQILYLTHFYRRARGLAKDHVAGLRRNTTYYCDPPELDARMHLKDESEKRGLNCRFVPAPRSWEAGEDVSAKEIRVLIDFIAEDRLRIMAGAAAQLIVEADTFEWNPKTGKMMDVRSDIVGHYDSIFGLKYLVMGLAKRSRRLIVPEELDLTGYRTRREELLACA